MGAKITVNKCGTTITLRGGTPAFSLVVKKPSERGGSSPYISRMKWAAGVAGISISAAPATSCEAAFGRAVTGCALRSIAPLVKKLGERNPRLEETNAAKNIVFKVDIKA